MILGLPQTPRVAVVGSGVLVERGSKSLAEMLDVCMMCDVLQILRNIIKGLQGLQMVYGAFKVEESMIRGTQGGEVLVWHNQRYKALKPDRIVGEDQ